MRDYWLPAITSRFGTIRDIFFFVDRCEEGTKIIEELGLKSHALISLTQKAWDYLLKIEVVRKEDYDDILSRKEDPEEWARKMLFSIKGVEKMRQLLGGDDKEYGKLSLMVNKGYPKLKSEVKDRLREGITQKLINKLEQL
mgnify:CR=1 FL=1